MSDKNEIKDNRSVNSDRNYDSGNNRMAVTRVNNEWESN